MDSGSASYLIRLPPFVCQILSRAWGQKGLPHRVLSPFIFLSHGASVAAKEEENTHENRSRVVFCPVLHLFSGFCRFPRQCLDKSRQRQLGGPQMVSWHSSRPRPK